MIVRAGRARPLVGGQLLQIRDDLWHRRDAALAVVNDVSTVVTSKAYT